MVDYQSSIVPSARHTRLHQHASKKIRRVRWHKYFEENFATTPRFFASASWDETIHFSFNEVVLWEIVADDDEDKNKGQEFRGSNLDDDMVSLTWDQEINWKFVRVAALEVDSDIQELQFLNDNHFLFATQNGDLVVVKWLPDESRLRPLHVFPQIHGDNEASLGFSLFGDDVVSIGSNGTLKRINVASMTNSGQPGANTAEIQDAVAVSAYTSNSGSFLCVEHLGVNEIITGNATGQLQLWDLRQRSQSSVGCLKSTVYGSGGVTVVSCHPGQRHIVGAGYQFGKLAFWDLRNMNAVLTPSVIHAHDGPIWEMAFHPISPSHLFTASNDGRLCHWDASGNALKGDVGLAPWLFPTDGSREQLRETNLLPENAMPVNSVDVCGDSILAGVDDKSIWMIKNLHLN